MNARNNLQRLLNRRHGPELVTFSAKEARAKEMFERIQEDDAVKYLVGAMQPIDPAYTKNTIAEADRVKSHLAEGFQARGVVASFDYQGSVTNDTHIFRYSDIDLLSLTGRFVFKENGDRIEPPQSQPLLPNIHLLVQHNASVDIIKTKIPSVTVDTSGGKAIQLSGGSLSRKVDIISSTWWDTIAYDASRQKHDRGIKLFNYTTHKHIPNKPFLHNFTIGVKDIVVNGNLRKVVRLLKTIKADANEEAGYTKVNLSSYDICAIGYSMGFDRLTAGADEELLLARNTQQYLDFLERHESFRLSLDVPNRTRKIFCPEGASIEGLRQLNAELKALIDEIARGLQRSLRTLEARIRR